MFKINLHMIHHWKALDLEIADFKYHQAPTPSGEIISSRTSNLKNVEFIKIYISTKFDTSLEMS